MSRAETYIKYCTLPVKAATQILPTFQNILKWKDNCKVLDIGCGPGNVTHDCLFPILPKSIKELIGIDKCNVYIEYAEEHYKDKILSFKVMDIVEDEVPKEYEQYFDYMTSFLCFHQINNHEVVFKKVKNMLKPDGEMLLYFPTTTTVFALYEHFSKMEKWKSYFSDYEQYCSPYKNSINVKEDIEYFFTTMGFQILMLTINEKKYKFTNSDFPRLLYTLVPIEIPEALIGVLAEESIQALRDVKLIKLDENGEEYLDFTYNLMVLHIKKKP